MTNNDLRSEMHGFLSRGEVPGLVALVEERGSVRVETGGVTTLGGSAVARDTIFRIASMSKPMAAAGAMILVEEGTLRLDDPVDALLPELAHRHVLRSLESSLDDTVPASRALTLRDLLTFRMGFGLIMAKPGTYPIQKAVQELGVPSFGPPNPPKAPPPDEWIRRFGTLPLLAQPGERWMYNTSSEVLGILVARAAKQPLDAFLAERIFAPLGMKDTAFHIPASKRDRFTTAYAKTESGFRVFDPAEGSAWAHPPAFPDASGGLVSTVDDCLAFARMMRDGGAANGTRILKEATVDAMSTNAITPAQAEGARDFLHGRGWGLGMAVPGAGAREEGTPPGAGWDGGLGSTFAWDRATGLIGVLLTNRVWDAPVPPAVYRAFWRVAAR